VRCIVDQDFASIKGCIFRVIAFVIDNSQLTATVKMWPVMDAKAWSTMRYTQQLPKTIEFGFQDLVMKDQNYISHDLTFRNTCSLVCNKLLCYYI
jgi:hypothetical protein